MTTEDHIAALCRRLVQAHQDKDHESIAACYSADAVICDLAPPLKTTGIDSSEVASWLSTWDGGIELSEESSETVADAAIGWKTSLVRMRGRKVDGTEQVLWLRSTKCFRKIDEEWLIVHEHSSVPFYMDGSLKAAVDLAPESEVSWDSSS